MSESAYALTKAGRTSPFVSYSLNYEDVILNRLFPTKRSGFYVDVGAGHPKYENDLFAFYQRGWSGINVEPNEHFLDLHRQIRPRDRNLGLILSDVSSGPMTYYQIANSGLSTCDDLQARAHEAHGHKTLRRRVAVDTLADILAEADVPLIDVLKVDVEGFEERVLSGNDWERFRPSVVLVEATFPESQQRRSTSIRGFMEQRGYRHVLFDGLNDFYLERSFEEPAGLTLPPNVFDHFVPREIADLRDRVASLQTNFDTAERYAHSLQAADDEARRGAAEKESEYDRALDIADALATENRKLQQKSRSQANETRRLRAATDRMQTEIIVLNRLLEPLHAAIEHQDQMVRRFAELVREHQQVSRDHVSQVERLQGETRHIQSRLQAVYASRSWLMTKPWRVVGRLLKRLGG